jgi:hypothetical protein
MLRRFAVLVTFAFFAIGVPSAWAAVTITSFSAEAASTLAGAHADASTSFSFLTTIDAEQGIIPSGGQPRDLVFEVPAGLVGNPQDVPHCPDAAFAVDGCATDTQVGAGSVTVALGTNGGLPVPIPIEVYNLTPPGNAPALFGLQVDITNFVNPQQLITVTAHAADNYAVTLTVPELAHISDGVVLGSSLTLWGVPADPSHDAQRACVQNGGLGCPSAAPRTPFIENPTDCSETPITTLSVNTYEDAGTFATATATSPNPSGCQTVPFDPSISLTPDSTRAGAPTGLGVELSVPQSKDPYGQGVSELKQAVVTLPQGMTVSPSAASSGLQGCTDGQFGAGSDSPAQCPAASVIGADEVESPLLAGPLTGKVYLGQPLSTDPTSGQMFRIFQELQGFGLDVKVQGSVVANPQTGQLTATFSNLPELPFEHFRLHFTNSANAVLVNPPTCGLNTTITHLYPYSNPATPATPSSSFTTSYDGNGSPCPAALPFAPSSAISTASSQAGGFSPLTVSFSRGDGMQPLGQITANLPPGLLGYVSAVPLCEAADAAAGTCAASSRVGVVSTTAGAGSDPLTVPGSVYLAQGSGGYPFALSVVVPAVAGPYDLGNVVVLVNLKVNSDGSITAISGPLPAILDGIPLDIRSVALTTDRPGFTFLPTNCAPLSMGGTATSLSGSVAPISAAFQASGCASLPFAPSFTVATQGSTSKANGASLTVRIAQKPGEADIHSVHVELPLQLPSRLTTLQKACTETQFANNPAGCPAGSVVGTAKAITPTLSSPLTGPALLVSHGGAAFPDLEMVLQGEGVTVILDGQTDIKKGITSSTFASAPDVPLSAFQLTLPQGPYSLLAATGTLCTSKLLMPTTIVGWNGLVVKQSTRIAVTGCAPSKPSLKVISYKVNGNTLSLVASVPGAGRVTASGNALRRASQKAGRAATVTLKLALSKQASASHASHRRVRIKVRVVFSPTRGSGSSISTTLTFR